MNDSEQKKRDKAQRKIDRIEQAEWENFWLAKNAAGLLREAAEVCDRALLPENRELVISNALLHEAREVLGRMPPGWRKK